MNCVESFNLVSGMFPLSAMEGKTDAGGHKGFVRHLSKLHTTAQLQVAVVVAQRSKSNQLLNPLGCVVDGQPTIRAVRELRGNPSKSVNNLKTQCFHFSF